MRIRFKEGPGWPERKNPKGAGLPQSRKNTGGKAGWCGAGLRESGNPLYNPGCGWYHIYTFEAAPPADGRPVEQEVWLDEACLEEQLALVLIDIGAFRAGAISEEALLHIRRIFAFFRKADKQMILRFAYDRQGRGQEREPALLSLVKRHMEQLGACIRDYAEDILAVQGLFVGNWGEMHGSRFLDDDSMCGLMQTLYYATEGKCFLAVRTPAQWRRIAARLKDQHRLLEKLALYNDGMFGSDTDMGTYGSAKRSEAGEREKWNRREELEWQNLRLAHVPNGGEVLAGDFCRGYRQAADEMRRMHVSYLNSIYHPDRLDAWRRETVEEGCFEGVTGYDYIGCHLGYRFVVRNVTARKMRRELCIVVENCGFGNLCEEAACVLVTVGSDGDETEDCLDTDARKWESGERVTLSAKMPDRSGRIFLRLRRKRDGRDIRFANQGADGKLLLGEYKDVRSVC